MATVRTKKPKGLPKRYNKRSKAGYYVRAFARAAEHKKRNIARQKRRAERKNAKLTD
jgi:hypothetical protein